MATCVSSVAHRFSGGMGRYCGGTHQVSPSEESHHGWRGGRSKVSGSIDKAFTDRGWTERKFATQIRIDQNVYDSPTHKVDCFKKTIGLELEWNNKTEFYDRNGFEPVSAIYEAHADAHH